MKIINRKDIYNDWLTVYFMPSKIYATNVFVNYLLASMILDLFIHENEDVWVQFNPEETDKQKCVIETIYDEIIYSMLIHLHGLNHHNLLLN